MPYSNNHAKWRRTIGEYRHKLLPLELISRQTSGAEQALLVALLLLGSVVAIAYAAQSVETNTSYKPLVSAAASVSHFYQRPLTRQTRILTSTLLPILPDIPICRSGYDDARRENMRKGLQPSIISFQVDRAANALLDAFGTSIYRQIAGELAERKKLTANVLYVVTNKNPSEMLTLVQIMVQYDIDLSAPITYESGLPPTTILHSEIAHEAYDTVIPFVKELPRKQLFHVMMAGDATGRTPFMLALEMCRLDFAHFLFNQMRQKLSAEEIKAVFFVKGCKEVTAMHLAAKLVDNNLLWKMYEIGGYELVDQWTSDGKNVMDFYGQFATDKTALDHQLALVSVDGKRAWNAHKNGFYVEAGKNFAQLRLPTALIEAMGFEAATIQCSFLQLEGESMILKTAKNQLHMMEIQKRKDFTGREKKAIRAAIETHKLDQNLYGVEKLLDAMLQAEHMEGRLLDESLSAHLQTETRHRSEEDRKFSIPTARHHFSPTFG